MRIWNVLKGRQAAKLFRLCVCIFIAVTLVAGGMALNPTPVQAVIGIDPAGPISDNLTECIPYSITFSPNGTSCPGSTIFFYWVGGALPAWLTLDMNTGELSGCPPPGSVAGSPYGPFSIGVSELRIFPWCWAFSIPPCSVTLNVNPVDNITIIPTYYYTLAIEDMPFSMPLSATGCSGNYTWSAAGLPMGLNVDPVGGLISGIPALGTAGVYTVTVTATDTVACCCPPGSRSFILIIDSYAAYVAAIIYSSYYDFTAQIGPGLTSGQTPVIIDGLNMVTLGGNQSQTFTAHPGEIHVVTVDATVPGTDPRTRFAVSGPNQTMVSESNSIAYFDYAQEVFIDTGSDPAGVAQPPGAGFYAVGGLFSAVAPSPVAGSQDGIKYVFQQWKLPDGGTNPGRDISFTVNTPGTVRAVYDTYYLLQLKSDYPAVNEASWELKDSTASYDLALQDVPMTGFWGFLGGTIRPENSSGTHMMTGPYTQRIEWYYDYTIPVVILILIALVIIGLVVFLVVWSKRTKKTGVAATTATQPPPPPPSPPPAAPEAAVSKPVEAAATEEKALPEAGSKEKPNFCPSCGTPVDKDAEFCKKCGKKLT